MSVKNCEKVGSNQVALTVEVDAAAFEAAIEKAYRKMRGQISIHGFRKGKAPRKIIENLYGVEVFFDEAVNIAMPDAYTEAVQAEKLEPVGYPEVELLDVSKDGFSFKATVYVYPEVKLGQYKGLSAPKAEVKVSAADVNHRLEEMAQRNSRLVGVDRSAEKGDTVNIDYEGFDNGKPFAGGKAEGFDLELGSGSFVPGFEDQLIGMSAGEEKDIDITFPEDYHADLAGKAVVFHVKVNAVKVKEVPAIDDEFAKDVSEFDTLDELKADVRGKITAEREEAAGRAFEDILMGKVADGLTGEIPDAMVEAQAQRFVDNFRMQIQSQGLPFDKYLEMTKMDVDSLLEQAKEPAARQVKMDLAVGAIIKAEGLEATDEDVDAEYEKMAKQYGMEAEEIKKYMDAEVIREQVLRDKAIRVVVDSAVAVEPVIQAEESAQAPAEEAPAEEKPKAKRTRKKKTAEEPAEASESAPEAAE